MNIVKTTCNRRFDIKKAERVFLSQANNGRGTSLWKTKKGSWVLESWTQWAGDCDSYELIEPEEAKEFLIDNDIDEALKHFPDVENFEDDI